MGDGQSSVEFMACVMLLLLLFIIMQAYMFHKTLEGRERRVVVLGNVICKSLAERFTIAGYSEGYSGEFTIPASVEGLLFNVSIYEGTVTVDYGQHSCAESFRAVSVKYEGESAPFNLTSGRYRLNNTGGVLYIEKIS